MIEGWARHSSTVFIELKFGLEMLCCSNLVGLLVCVEWVRGHVAIGLTEHHS